MKIVLLSPNCSKCRELLDNSLFRQFVSELLKDDGVIAIGDESYIYGFDYTDKNIYFNRIGYETPSVLDLDSFDISAIGDFTVNNFVSFLKKMPRYYRPRKSEDQSEEKGRKRSSSRSGSRSEFVARKKLKKEIKKASSNCVNDVCVEV